jgi:hypothetical protein
MSALDIVITVLISAAFVAVVGTIIYKKITHKGGGCDCGCSGCPHACNCSSHKNEKKK